MAKKAKEITCEIGRIYGYLSEKENKVLVNVAWNGGPMRCELRKCWKDKDGNLVLGAGIPLDDKEIDELVELLKKKPKPVDFNEIFDTSIGVMDKRAAGFRTEDGFITLRKRGSHGL